MELLEELLGKIGVVHLKTAYVILENGELPAFKGSAIRGVIGHVLRKLSCSKDCYTYGCHISCPYQMIFETPDGQQGFLPHPFVIKSSDSHTTFKKGDLFDFEIVIFGSAQKFSPLMIECLKEIGDYGLGVNRLKMEIKNIVALSKETVVVYPNEEYADHIPPLRFSSIEGASNYSKDQILIEFLTPTRILHKGKLQKSLEFSVLTKAIIHRLKQILDIYYPDLAFEPDLKVQSDNVVSLVDSLKMTSTYRYSNRKQQKMRLDGLVGIQKYQGDGIRDIWPLFRIAEILHIGKSSSMGYGQVKVWF